MNKTNLPETVTFIANKVECIAAVVFGNQYLLNMRVCTINFPEKPSIHIEYLPHAARVQFNDGQVWFDTDEICAAQIEHLFLTGKAPK